MGRLPLYLLQESFVRIFESFGECLQTLQYSFRRDASLELFELQVGPLKPNNIFDLARPLHCIWHGPGGRVRRQTKRDLNMYSSLTIRNAATAFAGAFITALLFVSAATSLLIA